MKWVIIICAAMAVAVNGGNMGPLKEHKDIVFDRVITNVGNGYNTQTGHFIAPSNGTYHFNVVVSAQGRQKVQRASVLHPSIILRIADITV